MKLASEDSSKAMTPGAVKADRQAEASTVDPRSGAHNRSLRHSTPIAGDRGSRVDLFRGIPEGCPKERRFADNCGFHRSILWHPSGMQIGTMDANPGSSIPGYRCLIPSGSGSPARCLLGKNRNDGRQPGIFAPGSQMLIPSGSGSPTRWLLGQSRSSIQDDPTGR
jgi:hypothetical protein